MSAAQTMPRGRLSTRNGDGGFYAELHIGDTLYAEKGPFKTRARAQSECLVLKAWVNATLVAAGLPPLALDP